MVYIDKRNSNFYGTQQPELVVQFTITGDNLISKNFIVPATVLDAGTVKVPSSVSSLWNIMTTAMF